MQLVGGDRVVWIPRESNSAHIGTRDTLDNPENGCTPAEMCRRIGGSGLPSVINFVETFRGLQPKPKPHRRRSCLPLRTGQCSRPIGTFTLLLARTRRRTHSATRGQRIILRNLNL
jgi:hypothetical protein